MSLGNRQKCHSTQRGRSRKGWPLVHTIMGLSSGTTTIQNKLPIILIALSCICFGYTQAVAECTCKYINSNSSSMTKPQRLVYLFTNRILIYTPTPSSAAALRIYVLVCTLQWYFSRFSLCSNMPIHHDRTPPLVF